MEFLKSMRKNNRILERGKRDIEFRGKRSDRLVSSRSEESIKEDGGKRDIIRVWEKQK